jgi:hypothetical protein
VTLTIPGEVPRKWIGRDGRNPRQAAIPPPAAAFPKIEIPRLDEVQMPLLSPEDCLPCSSPEADDRFLPNFDTSWESESSELVVDFVFGEDMLGG